MSFYRTGAPVSINVRMIDISGNPVTGLTQAQILLTLIQSGITQNILGLYNIAEQQNGVYRITLNPPLTNTPDTDYVLIASDLTSRALTDAIEFTLYNESIDTVKAFDSSNNAGLVNQLNIIESYTSAIQPSLNDPNHGLSALQTLLNNLSTQLSLAETTIAGDVVSSNVNQTNLLNQIISNESSHYSSLFTEINAVLTQFSTIATIVSAIQSAVNNGTYGLAALKAELDAISAGDSIEVTTIINAINSATGITNTKVDGVASNVNTAILDILVNTNLLNEIISYVNAVQPTLNNATYGLAALKNELDAILSGDTLEVSTILGAISSSSVITNTKVDTVNTNLLSDFNALTSQVGAIPINPLLTNDSRVSNLSKLDTTVSSLPAMIAQQVWSYGARYLTGASGVNQIDINGFEAQFVVGNPVVVNVILLDSGGSPVTGRTYPGNLNIGLWKGGVLDSAPQLATITVNETSPGVYRTTIPGALIDTPSIDYLLVVSDSSSVGVTQREQFSAFQIIGVAGPRIVTVIADDSQTALPIPDVQVYFKDPTNTMIINKGLTDVSGKYTTGLTDGTYNVILRKSFVDFQVPIQLVVNTDTTAVYLGTSFSPSSPTSPSTCVVYGWISGLDGKAVRNAKIVADDLLNSRYSGSYKIGKVTKATSSDINGYWELELIKSSQLIPPGVPYQVTQTYAGVSYEHDIIVPDSSSVNFSTL